MLKDAIIYNLWWKYKYDDENISLIKSENSYNDSIEMINWLGDMFLAILKSLLLLVWILHVLTYRQDNWQ